MPIKHPSLYRAAYRFACSMISASVPLGLLPRETEIFRIVGGTTASGRVGADLYRTVYRSSIRDDYRWTGLRDTGKPGAGGVYTTLDLDALLGETWKHAFGGRGVTSVEGEMYEEDATKRLTGPDVETALRARRLFIYRLRSNLTYGNLSMAPGEGWAFWDRLDKEPDLREELRRARYAGARAAANADGDHSFARALGQAVRDRLAKLPAIRVTSARTDAATTGLESGDNLVFFGGDGTRIDVLGPFREVTFAAWSGGKIGQVIRAL